MDIISAIIRNKLYLKFSYRLSINDFQIVYTKNQSDKMYQIISTIVVGRFTIFPNRKSKKYMFHI